MNVPAAEYSRDAVCVIVLLNTDDLAQAKEANAMPQDPPFTASRRKLARAMRYIEELDQSIEKYFSGKWYTCTFDETKGLNLTIFGVPRDADMAAGDAIHNMRSALDLLAVEAVKRGGGDPKDVYYPFCEKRASFEATFQTRKLHKAPAPIQAIVRGSKPYPDGDATLHALHKLDIRDKHQALIAIATDATTPAVRVVTDAAGVPVGFAEGKLKIELDTSTSPKAEFVFSNDCPLAGQPIGPTLRALWESVAAIVDSATAACSA